MDQLNSGVITWRKQKDGVCYEGQFEEETEKDWAMQKTATAQAWGFGPLHLWQHRCQGLCKRKKCVTITPLTWILYARETLDCPRNEPSHPSMALRTDVGEFSSRW